MTVDEIVALARQLRDLGVSRFEVEGAAVEFDQRHLPLPDKAERTPRQQVLDREAAAKAARETERKRVAADLAGVL